MWGWHGGTQVRPLGLVWRHCSWGRCLGDWHPISEHHSSPSALFLIRLSTSVPEKATGDGPDVSLSSLVVPLGVDLGAGGHWYLLSTTLGFFYFWFPPHSIFRQVRAYRIRVDFELLTSPFALGSAIKQLLWFCLSHQDNLLYYYLLEVKWFHVI